MASKLPRLLQRTAKAGAAVGALYIADENLNYSSFTRSIRALWNGLMIAVDYKMNFTKDNAAEILQIHSRAAQRILETCQTNGGLFIKLGQGIALQNHILPPEFNERFKILYDQAPAVPYNDVVKIFKQDFNGLTPEEVFATFDTEPVASASIAQVHKATLKDGTVVAVKVQKPYIRWQMGFDLLCYKILCHAFEFAFDLPVVWSVDFTSRHLRAEADFENEARSAERAYAELMKEPKLRDDVYVPRVHWDLTSKRVMTAEWIEGIPLVRTRDVSQAFDKKWVVQKVVDTFSHQIFQSGWVHADPHPGNLMVRRVNGKPQLVLLDHGLYVEETPAFINTYAEFWRALLLADISALERICESWGIRDVKMMSSATLQRPFDPERAKREGRSALEKPTLEEIYRMQTEVKEKAKEFLSDTGRIPRELIFVGRNMNLVRAVNKSYGSPVDRVGEMSRWAVSAFTKAPISSYNTMSLMSQRSPSVFGVRDYFSSLFVYLRFNAALFVVSVGFAATKVWAWVQGNILRRDKVKNYEELLEDQARDIMAQYGMLLPEDAFDA